MLGHNVLKDLASQARHGLNVIHDGEDAIMDGWLIYGKALNEGREVFPSNKEFGQWLQSENLSYQLGRIEIRLEDRLAAMWAADFEDFADYRKAHPNVRTIRGYHAKWKVEQKAIADEAAKAAAIAEAGVPSIVPKEPVLSVEQQESIDKVKELCAEDYEMIAAVQELVDNHVFKEKEDYVHTPKEQENLLELIGQTLSTGSYQASNALSYKGPDEVALATLKAVTRNDWAHTVHDKRIEEVITFLTEQAPLIGAELIKLNTERKAPQLKVV